MVLAFYLDCFVSYLAGLGVVVIFFLLLFVLFVLFVFFVVVVFFFLGGVGSGVGWFKVFPRNRF